MTTRRFDIPDRVVLANLESLDRMSTQSHPLTNEQFHDALRLILQIHELLPPEISRQIPVGGCYVGDSLWDCSQERRDRQWARITADLGVGLDAVLVNQTNVEPQALGDRPQTQGERILALVTRWHGNEDRRTVASLLERATIGTDASFDAKQLTRLTCKKRVPDSRAHDAEMSRLIHRIVAIAERSHHRG